MKYYQQGDCLIKPIKAIPSDTLKQDRTFLIEGEHTGHAHRVTEGEFEISTQMQRIFLRAITECKISHEEHKAFVVPPGTYEIDQVREYDPFQEAVRRVQD